MHGQCNPSGVPETAAIPSIDEGLAERRLSSGNQFMALGGDAPPATLGSFASKGDNGRAVTAPSLLDAAIPFVEQLFLKSLALVESEEVTPHEAENST